MAKFRATPPKFASVCLSGCSLALIVLFAFSPIDLNAQTAALLRGVIRDSQGKPVYGVTLQLQPQDTTRMQTAHSDSQGNYSFSALPSGVYVLRARMSGYNDAEIASLFIAPNEVKTVDLVLSPGKAATSQPASAHPPEFFDPPQFAVAGVTDTTSLGGHGSDTIVRTREALAKETVSLSHTPAGDRPGATSEKEKSLRDAVQRDPRSFAANHLLGKLLDENGKSKDALPYLDRSFELKPDDYENAYDIALANAHAGNYERARDQAQALLAHHDTAELHHLLADVQEKLGNPLAAVREYERAAALDPREPYLFDWGSELLLHHAPDPALEVFTKGNRLFPHSVRMLIAVSAAWFARGSYDQAAQRICEASDLDPSDALPYLFMGRMQTAEPAASLEIVEKLRRFQMQQPENAEANYYYAVGLWKLRKGPEDTASAEQVESLLTHAIHLDPKFASAYLQLGILHSEKKNYPQAISDYRQAIQADLNLEEAHYRLGQAYRQVGDTANAEAEIRICDQLTKKSAEELERERHEIRQFVYILRDQPPAQRP